MLCLLSLFPVDLDIDTSMSVLMEPIRRNPGSRNPLFFFLSFSRCRLFFLFIFGNYHHLDNNQPDTHYLYPIVLRVKPQGSHTQVYLGAGFFVVKSPTRL